MKKIKANEEIAVLHKSTCNHVHHSPVLPYNKTPPEAIVPIANFLDPRFFCTLLLLSGHLS